jgi:hypothetical protein
MNHSCRDLGNEKKKESGQKNYGQRSGGTTINLTASLSPLSAFQFIGPEKLPLRIARKVAF